MLEGSISSCFKWKAACNNIFFFWWCQWFCMFLTLHLSFKMLTCLYKHKCPFNKIPCIFQYNSLMQNILHHGQNSDEIYLYSKLCLKKIYHTILFLEAGSLRNCGKLCFQLTQPPWKWLFCIPLWKCFSLCDKYF